MDSSLGLMGRVYYLGVPSDAQEARSHTGSGALVVAGQKALLTTENLHIGLGDLRKESAALGTPSSMVPPAPL